MIINYNGQKIELSYNSIGYLNKRKGKIVLNTHGSSKGQDYGCVEQEAQMYLIKHAVNKMRRKDKTLVQIVGISQDVSQDYEGDVEIKLSGKAIFDKN